MGELEGTGEPGQAKLTPHVNRVRPASPTAYEAAGVMKLRGPVGPAGSEEGL